MNDLDKKSLDGNAQHEHYHHHFSYHRVNTFDPNLGTAAARYSPPQYCEENVGLNECPNGTYENVILIQNSGNIMGHENGLLSVAEAAQTIESGILDQYNILPSDHRIITYVRTINDVNTDQVYEAQQHHLMENNDELKSYQSNHHQHDDNDSFVHHQNLTDESGGTQIIFRRSPNGRMYQQIHNFILNNDADSNTLSVVNNDQNGGNIVAENHSIVGEIEQTFTPYDTSSEPNLPHQNHEMIVVPNDERIGLYFNNGVPYEQQQHQNETNLLIESNPNHGYSTMENTNENQQQNCPNTICDQNNGIDNFVRPVIEDKDQLLEMTMSPLLAAINDITNKSRSWSQSPSNVKPVSSKATNAMQYYDSPTSAPAREETSTANNTTNNNYKIINIRSSLSDEYVDINDVKTIQFVEPHDGYVDDENEYELSGVRRSKRTKKLETFLMVADKHVPCRAWASLPTSYLYIAKQRNSSNEYTVYSKKDIPLRTKFGPFEGDIRDVNEGDLDKLKCDDTMYPLLLIGEKCLDVSNENTSNWMRFVRFAKSYSQQNLLLFESDEKLYFKSSQFIQAKEELRVGYSREYAEKYQLPLLKPNGMINECITENTSDYWSCFECDSKFKTSEELQKHLDRDHERDVPTKVSRRKRHLQRKGSTRYACPVCSKTFFKNVNFRRHLKNHSGNPLLEKHLSDSNGNKLANKHTNSSGQRNVNKIKTIASKKLNIKNKENQFKCGFCSKSFLNDERLKRHVMVHGPSELKPYQCSHCAKRFLNGSALAAHVKIHLYGKFYFQCQLCSERFKHNSEFTCHVKTHMIDNSYYLCKFCNKKFLEYVLIRKHTRAFHPAVKHPCTVCDKKFSNTDKLRMHMLIHSDKKEFSCTVCGKEFKRKDKLKEHIKRIHTKSTAAKCEKTAGPLKTRQKETTTTSSEIIFADGNLMEHNAFENCNGFLEINKSVGNIGDATTEGEDEKKCNKKKKTKFLPKVSPNDYQRFIYKCHDCLLGFKRRGMLVNHLAKRHPDIRIDSVPELNLPILKAQKFFYCQYCNKVYRSSGKRKYHILKCHPGSELPVSGRQKGGDDSENNGYPTYSETVSTITTHPHLCDWCHKQYASKPKLVEHQRKKHADNLEKLNAKAVKNSNCYLSSVDSPQIIENGYKENTVDKYHPNGVDYDINSTTHFNGNTVPEPTPKVPDNNTISQFDCQTIFDDMYYLNLRPVPVTQSVSPPTATASLMENSKKVTTYVITKMEDE